MFISICSSRSTVDVHNRNDGHLTTVRSQAWRRQKTADEVPMPCISPNSRSRVFQWLELEPFGREPDSAPVRK